jgi:hypothetical protein
MTFLKQLARVIVQGMKIVVGLQTSGVFQRYDSEKVAHVIGDLQAIEQIVVQTEVFGQVLNTPGADKLRAASAMAGQYLLTSSLLAGRKVENPALLEEGIAEITEGVVKVLNALKPEVKTENVT